MFVSTDSQNKHVMETVMKVLGQVDTDSQNKHVAVQTVAEVFGQVSTVRIKMLLCKPWQKCLDR